MYLQAAAVEMHSALSTCRNVAITMGAKLDKVKEIQHTLDAYPVAALLNPPKRPRPEGPQGTSRHGSGSLSRLQENAPKRPLK